MSKYKLNCIPKNLGYLLCKQMYKYIVLKSRISAVCTLYYSVSMCSVFLLYISLLFCLSLIIMGLFLK